MAKKTFSYDMAKAYVKDKDKAINTFVETSLDKTQQIFVYANLPDTIPQSELENLLQVKGHCVIVEHEGKLYALHGGFSGEEDVYGNPRFYTVSNVALNLYKTYEIGVDCILVKNDFHHVGLLPTIQKYGVLLLDTELSLNTAAILSRITMLISAPDDKTKASAELFIQKILDGDFSVIGENGFFEGIKMQTAGNTNSNYIIQLVELIQYYKASFLNEIGLQANYNMKRERLIADEVAMNVDNLLPFIENMFSERVAAVAKVNDMFDTDIVVDYNGVWKTTHEHAEKEEVFADTDLEGEGEGNATTAFLQSDVSGKDSFSETEDDGENHETETASSERTENRDEANQQEMGDSGVTIETEESNETEESEESTDETVESIESEESDETDESTDETTETDESEETEESDDTEENDDEEGREKR